MLSKIDQSSRCCCAYNASYYNIIFTSYDSAAVETRPRCVVRTTWTTRTLHSTHTRRNINKIKNVPNIIIYILYY